ncbi:MAG: zinc-ribbon domain containing protein [Oligoflexia bacterium]|nr:zinc-ribbon domain containing protein [Oligoflexia bacterium]
MSYSDKTLQCKDCGVDFTFTSREQEFYAQKGFQNEPTRCKPCRDNRKTGREGGGGGGGGGRGRGGEDRGDRQMFSAVCSTCGAQTQVPFKPDPAKPVYCRDCFKKSRS